MIEVKQVTKFFDDKKLFENLSFNVECGEFLGVFGRSGCGKTTLLRSIGGFEKLDSGEVSIDGHVVTKPMKSAILVFQTFDQLLPWKTVIENITFPLLTTNNLISKKDATNTAIQYLVDVGLESIKDKYPHKLSGGMKQQVVLARALSLKPKVILMDEPFASLDNITRQKMSTLTKQICMKYNITVIFVSHNIKEILFISGNILLFDINGSVKYFKNDNIAEKKLSDFESEILMSPMF